MQIDPEHLEPLTREPEQRDDLPIRRVALEPLAVDPAGAAELLGLSRSMFYKMDDAGQIGPMGRRFGKAVRYSVAELRAWAAAGMPTREAWARMKNSDN